MTYRPYATLVAASLAAFAIAAHATSDFVFGEDFEGVPACGTGDVVLVTPASRATTLGTTNLYLVKVRACSAAAAVNLAESGAPVSWTTTLDPPSLSIPSGAIRSALMTVVVPTDGDSGLGTFDVTAQDGATTAHGSATLTVANEFIIHFAPDGTDSGHHAFPASLSLKLGAKVRLFSDDTTSKHLIHADGTVGPHELDSGISAGQEYDVTAVSIGNSGHLYCHSHLSSSGQTIVTVVAP